MNTPATVVTLCLLAGTAMAQTPQDLANTIKQACQKELDTYCKAVLPGEGRTFACLYAYSDKLSGSCEYALYDTSVELGYVISRLNYVANACSADLDNYCSDNQPGQGRLTDCLKNNQNRLSAACQQAAKETGLISP